MIAPPVPSVPASVETSRMDLLGVLGRLDATQIGLIAIAALVVLLLAWRVVAMVRRERPVVPQRRVDARDRRASGARAAARTTDSLTRQTLSANSTLGAATQGPATHWGFDENKRSSLARADGGKRDVMPLDTSTQWPAVDRARAAAQVPTDDALGHSPQRRAGASGGSPYRTGTNPYFLGNDVLDAQIDVEEVADVMTQAELLVQLGDPKEAMGLLSRHIRETEKPGPQVWLMLLDLYQSTGREAQYNALADGFRALFNAAVPPWATQARKAERTLEDYPQVMKTLLAAWPSAECRGYLERLLNDDRGGSRQGFSLTAYREILLLVDVLDTGKAIEAELADRREIDRKLAAQ